jgi:hypothetical protein
MLTHLDDAENYDIREGEFVMSSVVGWQFGDGHLHDEFFINAVQERCQYAPGELMVVLLESQPWHTMTQKYRIVDAAVGVVERGVVDVRDMTAAQPWLADGPIPYRVTWRASDSAPSAPTAPTAPAAPAEELRATAPVEQPRATSSPE